jgi:hypothetical protein
MNVLRVYHGPYRAGQAADKTAVVVSSFMSAASGCKGRSSRCSSTPCPSVFPGPTARSSLGRDVRRRSLSRKGKGSGPCTPGLRPDRCGGEAAVFFRPSHVPHSTQGGVCGACFGASSDAFISVPFFRMRRFLFSVVVKIRDVLSWYEWKLHPWGRSRSSFLHVVEGPQILIRVQTMNDGGSHHMEICQITEHGSFHRVGIINSAYVWQVIDLLQKSASLIGPNRLPIVELEGQKWFFDGRLRQLRSLRTPVEFVDLILSPA